MGDVFKEQIVKRKTTAKDTIIRICLVILVILIFFVALMVIPSLAVIIAAAAGFGAFVIMGFLNVEYEYVFTNGELDIDAIYNKSRRKRLFTAKVNDFEIMAHIEDRNHEGAFNNIQEFRDYSSGNPGPDTYVCLLNYNSKRLKLIIEPNEKMLKAIAGSINRRKLHLRPGVVLVS